MRIREKRLYATSNTRNATNNNNNGITAAPPSTPRKPCTFAPSLLTNRRPSITSSNKPLTTQLGATTTTTTATIILPHQQQTEDDVTTNKKTLQHPSAPLCSSLRTTLSGGYSPLSTGGSSSQQQQPKRPKILVAPHLQPHMQHHLPSDQFFFNSLIKPQDRRGLPTFQYTQSTNKQHSFEQRFLSGTEDSLRNRGPVGIPPSRSKQQQQQQQQQQLKLPMYAKSKVYSDEDDFDVDYDDTYDIDDERENGDEFHGDLFHEDHQGRIIWKHAPPSSQPILTKASIAAGQYHQSWGVHQRPSQPLPKLKLPNLGIVTCENFSSNYRQILRLLLDKDVLMSKAVDVAPASSSGGGDGEDITNMSYGNLSLTQHNVPNAVSPVPPVISTSNTNGNSQSMVSGGGGMNKSVLRRFSSEIEQENKVKMLKQLKAEMEAVDVDLDDLDQDITHEVEVFQAKYKGGHGHVVGLAHEVGGEHHSLLGVLPHSDHNDTSMWDFEV
eukprot:PhF_6_TR8675/c0_g1_i4/m.13579